jgi:hypothetical protein
VPADVSLGIAVQKQDRKAAAAMNDINDRSLSFDLLTNEFVKHEPGYNALSLISQMLVELFSRSTHSLKL